MTLDQILLSIQNWNKIQTTGSPAEIESYFADYTGFTFQLTEEQLAPKTTPIDQICYHCYVGVWEEKLHYFIIDSLRDTEIQYTSSEGLLPFIAECKMSTAPFPESFAQDIISKEQAQTLVDNWEKYGDEWIAVQRSTENYLYQAFVIPQLDILFSQPYDAYFGLNQKPLLPTFTPDLVLCLASAGDINIINYFDLVRPVPPFKAVGELAKDKFYLLELALNP